MGSSVVETHIVRHTVGEGQAFQHIDDTIGVDGAVDLDDECFAWGSHVRSL